MELTVEMDLVSRPFDAGPSLQVGMLRAACRELERDPTIPPEIMKLCCSCFDDTPVSLTLFAGIEWVRLRLRMTACIGSEAPTTDPGLAKRL